MGYVDAKRKCASELKKISGQLEADDRKAAMKEYDVSYVTVSRYLSGKVANIILGIALLNFFKKRIRRRQNQLTSFLKN